MVHSPVLAVTPNTQDQVRDPIGPASMLVARHGGRYLTAIAGSISHHFLIEGKDDLADQGASQHSAGRKD